ncbi:MAG TPA: GNAT family N-acetyltransferase [Pyrinomonadaceae bacterium]|nr:GNAT family N-acetyltransferase [Pyrinomonadaceae bacterium]
MSDERHAIREAAAEDLGDVLALLDSAGLPREGVAEHLAGFLVARDAAGRLVGCVGLERHGALGLLRSAAVAPGLQGSGLGTRLVSELLERAGGAGVREVLLLTTTARDFFVRRFGFAEARREEYDLRLARSPEWNLPRCSTAVLLRLELGGPPAWLTPGGPAA